MPVRRRGETGSGTRAMAYRSPCGEADAALMDDAARERRARRDATNLLQYPPRQVKSVQIDELPPSHTAPQARMPLDEVQGTTRVSRRWRGGGLRRRPSVLVNSSRRLRRFPFRGLRPRAAVVFDSADCTSTSGSGRSRERSNTPRPLKLLHAPRRTRGTQRLARGPCARSRSAGTCRPFRGSARFPTAPCARRRRPQG